MIRSFRFLFNEIFRFFKDSVTEFLTYVSILAFIVIGAVINFVWMIIFTEGDYLTGLMDFVFKSSYSENILKILSISFLVHTLCVLCSIQDINQKRISKINKARLILGEYQHLANIQSDKYYKHSSFWGCLFSHGLAWSGIYFLGLDWHFSNEPSNVIHSVYNHPNWIFLAFPWFLFYMASSHWIKYITEEQEKNLVDPIHMSKEFKANWQEKRQFDDDRRYHDYIDSQKSKPPKPRNEEEEEEDDSDNLPPRRY